MTGKMCSPMRSIQYENFEIKQHIRMFGNELKLWTMLWYDTVDIADHRTSIKDLKSFHKVANRELEEMEIKANMINAVLRQ